MGKGLPYFHLNGGLPLPLSFSLFSLEIVQFDISLGWFCLVSAFLYFSFSAL